MEEHPSDADRQSGIRSAFSVQTKDIGYAGVFDAMKAARAGRVKILALKKDNESQAVTPSQETVKNGTYPLVMQLYFYWDSGRAPDYLKQFVDFCKTKGAASF